jgi:DNA-directed RNA polymerase subunit M/transcription elongation factor TFIIS
MKSYTTKANAKRAAKSQNIDLSTIEIIEVAGKFSWQELYSAQEKEIIKMTGSVNCPCCGINLTNGLMTENDRVEGGEPMTKQFYCMGCGEEFGDDLIIPKRNKSEVSKPCNLVWDIADKMEGAKRKDVIEACVKAGVAFYTARTQYQLWKQATNA